MYGARRPRTRLWAMSLLPRNPLSQARAGAYRRRHSPEEGPMDLRQMAKDVSEAMTIQHVFGEERSHNGVTVIPVAAVRGGGGAGEGNEGASGSGGGFGVTARPAGVFVIRGNEVEWKAAVNATAVVLGGQLLAIVLALVFKSIVAPPRKRR